MASAQVTITKNNDVICIYCSNEMKEMSSRTFSDYRNGYTHLIKEHLQVWEAAYNEKDIDGLLTWAHHFQNQAKAFFMMAATWCLQGKPFESVKFESTDGRHLCSELVNRLFRLKNDSFTKYTRGRIINEACSICQDPVALADGHNICRHPTHAYHANCLEYQLERWLVANGNVMDGFVVDTGSFVRDPETLRLNWIPIGWNQTLGRRGQCSVCDERLTAEMALAKWCQLVRTRRASGGRIDRDQFPVVRAEHVRPVDYIEPVYSPDPILEATIDQVDSPGDDPSDDSDYAPDEGSPTQVSGTSSPTTRSGSGSRQALSSDEEQGRSSPQELEEDYMEESRKRSREEREYLEGVAASDAMLYELLHEEVAPSPKRSRVIPGVPPAFPE
jgi:hypothetical protein